MAEVNPLLDRVLSLGVKFSDVARFKNIVFASGEDEQGVKWTSATFAPADETLLDPGTHSHPRHKAPPPRPDTPHSPCFIAYSSQGSSQRGQSPDAQPAWARTHVFAHVSVDSPVYPQGGETPGHWTSKDGSSVSAFSLALLEVLRPFYPSWITVHVIMSDARSPSPQVKHHSRTASRPADDRSAAEAVTAAEIFALSLAYYLTQHRIDPSEVDYMAVAMGKMASEYRESTFSMILSFGFARW